MFSSTLIRNEVITFNKECLKSIVYKRGTIKFFDTIEIRTYSNTDLKESTLEAKLYKAYKIVFNKGSIIQEISGEFDREELDKVITDIFNNTVINEKALKLDKK